MTGATVAIDETTATVGTAYAGQATVTVTPSDAGPMHTFSALGGGYCGQLAFSYGDGVNQAHIRSRNGDNQKWGQWWKIANAGVEAELREKMRLQVKREIYAELVALNAGIVVPVVIK